MRVFSVQSAPAQPVFVPAVFAPVEDQAIERHPLHPPPSSPAPPRRVRFSLFPKIRVRRLPAIDRVPLRKEHRLTGIPPQLSVLHGRSSGPANYTDEMISLPVPLFANRLSFSMYCRESQPRYMRTGHVTRSISHADRFTQLLNAAGSWAMLGFRRTLSRSGAHAVTPENDAYLRSASSAWSPGGNEATKPPNQRTQRPVTGAVSHVRRTLRPVFSQLFPDTHAGKTIATRWARG